VEKAFGRRKDRSLRLAKKHIRAVQIIPAALDRLMGDNNAGQGTERDEGDARNGQDRHRAPAAGYDQA
jgi:hypothetical protein